jgi:hypothetical protein
MLIANHIEQLDKTAVKRFSAHTSDDESKVVPALRVGADVPSRSAAVSPATRAGGTA